MNAAELRFSRSGGATVIGGERPSDLCVVWAWPCAPFVLDMPLSAFDFGASDEFRAAVKSANAEAIRSRQAWPLDPRAPKVSA